MKKVSEIMSVNLQSVDQTKNLKEVKALFDDSGLSHLVVTDAVGTYKGIISRTDLLEKVTSLMLATSGSTYTQMKLDGIKATDIMTSHTVNLSLDDSLAYATELLLQKKFHSLPVVKNYRAEGIVTKHDLLQAFYEDSAYTKAANHE